MIGILGSTCTGKSKLSVGIARSFPAEIINCDKMQLYSGLDITTNKMPMIEREGVPHHLLSEFEIDQSDQFNPNNIGFGEITATDFRWLASSRIESIRSRQRIPIIAGGSNSFLHALLSEHHVPGHDPFVTVHTNTNNRNLRYRSCRLLWVDVEWTVLKKCIDKRVDVMVEMGMVEELESHFDLKRATEKVYRGLDRSIGVPEMDEFFLEYAPLPTTPATGERKKKMRVGREKARLEEAIENIKRNSRILARRQVGKINILRDVYGWDLLVLDGTEAAKRKMQGMGKDKIEEAWERDVMRPTMEELEMFFAQYSITL